MKTQRGYSTSRPSRGRRLLGPVVCRPGGGSRPDGFRTTDGDAANLVSPRESLGVWLVLGGFTWGAAAVLFPFFEGLMP